MEGKKEWWIYIVVCSDGSMYNGITTGLERRIAEHNDSKKGAKYTRNRRLINLVYSEILPDDLLHQNENIILRNCKK